MKSPTLKNIDFDSVVQNTKSSKSIFFNVGLFYHITLSQLPGHKYRFFLFLVASTLPFGKPEAPPPLGGGASFIM